MAGVSPYLLVALCSFLAYHVIYRQLAPLLVKTLVSQPYSSLDKAKQKYVNWLTVSLIYTSVVGPCALLVHHFDQDLVLAAQTTVLRYDSPIVRSLSAVLLGYTAGETVVTITGEHRTDSSLPKFLLHHAVTCWATLLTCVSLCLSFSPVV
uniref:Uncharacterized protein n=1 Tax=Branchiostoma floridae TaxID=7739 RepID=C3ZT57_BRAFL|eukprot:XP_002588252.1 hypothetical protein BRAFLDRAFT_86699 [Branchiostoma floridae]